MLPLTVDQREVLVRDIANSLRERGIQNPKGVTLLNELRKSSHRLFGEAIPNLSSIRGWFPDMLSKVMESHQEDATLSLLEEFSSRISAIEEQQNAIIYQNAEMLKYLKAVYRNSRRVHHRPKAEDNATGSKTLNIVVVGMEGGYREHLKNKLKGFPVKLTYKHYRDHFSTYGNADYIVYYAKGGHYFSQSNQRYPGRVYYGVGSLTTVLDVIMELLQNNKGANR